LLLTPKLPRKTEIKNPYTPAVKKSEIPAPEKFEEKPAPKTKTPILTPLPQSRKTEPVEEEEKKSNRYIPIHKRTRTQSAMPALRNKSPQAEEIDM
jgi:hypothetical protein